MDSIPQAKQHDPTSWTKVDENSLAKRFGHSSVIYKNYILTFGGYCEAKFLNDIFAFEILSREWISIQPTGAPLIPRRCHTMNVGPDGSIIVFGGLDPLGTVMKEIGIMRVQLKNKKIQIEYQVVEGKGEKALCRANHVANIYNNSMYVFGGADEKMENKNEVWSLDLDSFVWKKCKTSGESPGKSHDLALFKLLGAYCFYTSTLYQGKMYLFNSNSYMYTLDLETMDWQLINTKGSSPSSRRGLSAQEIGGKIYFFGGYVGNEFSNQLFAYSIDASEWEEIYTWGSAPRARAHYTSACYGNYLFILGGQRGSYYTDDLCYFRINKEKKSVLRPGIEVSMVKDLLANNSEADVVFRVEDKEFHANKVVLAKRYQYFNNMFESGMKEAKGEEILFKDIKATSFKAFLDFAYGEEIKDIDMGLAIELFKFSEKHVLQDLSKETQEAVFSMLSFDNFLEIARTAGSFEMINPGLVDYFIENFMIIKQRGVLEQFIKAIEG